MAERPLRERAAELIGAMLVAAGIAAVTSLVVFLIATPGTQVELYVWITLVVTLGSWAVMIPAKLFEGKVEDQAPMRFLLLFLGALLGVAAWGLAAGLMLSFPVGVTGDITPGESVMGEILGWHNFGTRLLGGGSVGLPLQICVAYFAFLFVLIRWWKQASHPLEVYRSPPHFQPRQDRHC